MRAGRSAGSMVGIYPKASGFRLNPSLSPRAGFLERFPPCLHVPLSFSPSPRGRGSQFILYATVAARETWSRVGGRYFGLIGSVVSGCAGPLSVFFGGNCVVWCGEGSRDHGGAPHWEEGTNYSEYMWLADC